MDQSILQAWQIPEPVKEVLLLVDHRSHWHFTGMSTAKPSSTFTLHDYLRNSLTAKRR